jgi:hypothetical protein
MCGEIAVIRSNVLERGMDVKHPSALVAVLKASTRAWAHSRMRRKENPMKVKMILPALTEARSPFFRPIKYSLFPPLGLATLAAYLSDEDEVVLQDEHVEKLDLEDEPDLVAIQVYITSARRAYELADHYRRKGAFV